MRLCSSRLADWFVKTLTAIRFSLATTASAFEKLFCSGRTWDTLTQKAVPVHECGSTVYSRYEIWVKETQNDFLEATPYVVLDGRVRLVLV